jgi:hypothetical protein
MPARHAKQPSKAPLCSAKKPLNQMPRPCNLLMSHQNFDHGGLTKPLVLFLGVTLSLVVSGCATRSREEAEPTPTPGEMDAMYQEAPVEEPQGEMPPPPAEEVAALPPAEAEPEPQPEPEAPEPTPTRTPKPAKIGKSYVVVKGDSLWLISGKPVAFSNYFMWPLIFKANRRKIIDPDLIEPGQKLSWKPNYSREESEDAIQKAQDTPAYVPHFTPRKSLPVKY